MTDQEIQQGIQYNRSQGFSKPEVRLIQEVAGAAQDGLWGKETVGAIWRWQDSQGIPADGKVWQSPKGNTWPRIQETAQAGADSGDGPSFRLGVWVDDPPQRVVQDSYADSLQELGVSTVAVMVNSANTSADAPPWKSRWQAQQLAQAGRLFDARGIDLVLTAWPRPSMQQLSTLMAEMEERMEASGAVALEVDVEGNWKSSFLDGFASLEEAGQFLVNGLRDRLQSGVRLELTTYPYHPEFTSAATIAPQVDVLLPQAYSVYNSSDPQTDWGARLGPGNLQTLGIRLARRVEGPQIASGLAAYYQDRYPGHSADEAMQTALDAVAASGVEEIRYWSSKWIIGGVQNDYSKAFLGKIG